MILLLKVIMIYHVLKYLSLTLYFFSMTILVQADGNFKLSPDDRRAWEEALRQLEPEQKNNENNAQQSESYVKNNSILNESQYGSQPHSNIPHQQKISSTPKEPANDQHDPVVYTNNDEDGPSKHPENTATTDTTSPDTQSPQINTQPNSNTQQAQAPAASTTEKMFDIAQKFFKAFGW